MVSGLERYQQEGDLHFVTFSCYHRLAYLGNPLCRSLVEDALERVRYRYEIEVIGYVVMPEHVHLLVSEPQRETLSTAVQALKVGVVRSMQCSSGGSVVAAPRSRKNGETWAPGQGVKRLRIAEREGIYGIAADHYGNDGSRQDIGAGWGVG